MAVVCGNCTEGLGRCLGTQILHDTVQDVKDCYDRRYYWEQVTADHTEMISEAAARFFAGVGV